MTTQTRHQAGAPASKGGEFKAQDRTEAVVNLKAATDAAAATSHEAVGQALADARTEIPVSWVLQSNAPGGELNIHAAFKLAAARLEGFDSDDMHPADRAMVELVREVATTAPGIMHGDYHHKASQAAAQLADWLLNRDERLAADGIRTNLDWYSDASMRAGYVFNSLKDDAPEYREARDAYLLAIADYHHARTREEILTATQ